MGSKLLKKTSSNTERICHEKEWQKKKERNKRNASKPAPSLANEGNEINSSAAMSIAFDTKSELWHKN